MKAPASGPLQPARIEFPEDGGPPRAPDFGDVYHPRAGAATQARHVFLAGNGLPARWAGREAFVLLETGFGLGLNFLTAWGAWQADPARPRRLDWVSLERHPLRQVDLARALADTERPDLAAALLAAWPPLARGLHRLRFADGERGEVVLTLGFGDALSLLPQLRLNADALVLDGFAPDRNPELWSAPVFKALARLAAPGCTAATWSVARVVQDGLAAAGFEVQKAQGRGGKREITTARFAPRHVPRGPAPLHVADASEAVVVGSGLAGAAAARALAREGLRVQVIDAAAEPASGASGNPAGLFHATVNADDGPYARLFRAAALHAAGVYREAVAAGVPGAVEGLLRLASEGQHAAGMRALLDAQGQPPELAQALPRAEAAGRCGLAVGDDAWLYPLGGWLDPAAWVRHALAGSGIRWCGGVEVTTLRREGAAWSLLDAAGRVCARAPLVVLANADGAARLWPAAGWALSRWRGQVSWWADGGASALRLPLAGDGYALPLPGRMLCGATRQLGDEDPQPREADHRANLARFERLTGLAAPADPAAWQGRVGWRVQAEDRLPLAGAVGTAAGSTPRHLLTQARHWPREPGLFVLSALGARGLTLAPLLGELVAAQALGRPWPLTQDLADAVDPVRWQVRAARQAGQAGAAPR